MKIDEGRVEVVKGYMYNTIDTKKKHQNQLNQGLHGSTLTRESKLVN